MDQLLTSEDTEPDLTIDIEQDWQVRWWSYGLRVTPEELRAAVLEVGSSANAVRDRLAAPAAQRHALRAAV